MEVTRRRCLLAAMAIPLALVVWQSSPVIGADIGMAMMGDLNGKAFVVVPRHHKETAKLVDWMIIHGWEISDKQLNKDLIQFERESLNSEVKPDGR